MADWKVGAGTTLPTSDSDAWDGATAASAVFAWAGGDASYAFDPAKARRAFLLYDAAEPKLKGSYKLPIARPISGELTVIKGGLDAAASRLPQTDAPQTVKDDARKVLDAYYAKYRQNDGADPLAILRALARRSAQGRGGDLPYETRAAHELRADAPAGTFAGYASVAWVVDSYATAMAPGAWQKSIAERGPQGSGKVRLLYAHDPWTTIGLPISLAEDAKGLAVTAAVADDGMTGSAVRAHLALAAKNELPAPYDLSVGFTGKRDRSAEDDDPLDFSSAPEWVQKLERSEIRVYTENKLFEFSTVPFAANEAATIDGWRQARSIEALALVRDGLRAGTLDADSLSLLSEIVALASRTAPAAPPQQASAAPEPPESDEPPADERSETRPYDGLRFSLDVLLAELAEAAA